MKLRLEELFDVLQHSAFNLINIMKNSETTNGRRALTNGTSSEVGKRGRPSAVSTQSPSTGESSKRARIDQKDPSNLPSDEQSGGEDQEKLNGENGVDLEDEKEEEEEEEEEFDLKDGSSSTYSNYKLAFISIVDTCRRYNLSTASPSSPFSSSFSSPLFLLFSLLFFLLPPSQETDQLCDLSTLSDRCEHSFTQSGRGYRVPNSHGLVG
jgi:hypothetical protein